MEWGSGTDRDSEWSLGQSGLHGGDALWGDGVNGGDLDASGGVLAVSVLGNVWVGGVSLDTVRLYPFLGVVVGSTMAVVVWVNAIDEHLLGEGDDLTSLDGVMSLNGLDGGESPA